MRIWIARVIMHLEQWKLSVRERQSLETVSNTIVSSFNIDENLCIRPEFMPSLACPGKLHVVLVADFNDSSGNLLTSWAVEKLYCKFKNHNRKSKSAK